ISAGRDLSFERRCRRCRSLASHQIASTTSSSDPPTNSSQPDRSAVMADLILARALHVLSVLMWIGGGAVVTTVVMPAIRRQHPPDERLAAFHRIEERFAPQARLWVMLAGASGFWMVYRADMWERFGDPGFWWMHAMVGVWAIFVVMLFVIEPLFLH